MFILSKVLLFLLFPVSWVFIIFIWACAAKSVKRRKTLIICGLAVLYLFSIPIVIDGYAKLWRYPDGKPTLNRYSAAIVLGGFSSEKADGTGYFNGAADRFIQGLKLYTTGKVTHILISGGSANLISTKFREADWVKGQLRAFNVPDTAILIDNQSRNTLENALFSKRVLQSRHLQPPYLLVTSDFHMRRSAMLFNRAGLDVIPYTSNYNAGVSKTDFQSFMPSAFVLASWELYNKELVGYFVDGILHLR